VRDARPGFLMLMREERVCVRVCSKETLGSFLNGSSKHTAKKGCGGSSMKTALREAKGIHLEDVRVMRRAMNQAGVRKGVWGFVICGGKTAVCVLSVGVWYAYAWRCQGPSQALGVCVRRWAGRGRGGTGYHRVPPGYHQGTTRVPPGYHQGTTLYPQQGTAGQFSPR
jgi:hypothetical protein